MQSEARPHALQRPSAITTTTLLAMLAMLATLLPTTAAHADELPHDFDIESACAPGEAPATSFRDIGPPHDQAIRCLAWFDIAQGRTSTHFGTNEDVTRAQAATFIVRLLERVDGLQLPARDRGAFSDVGGDSEFARNIETLANVTPPILEGFDDGTFRPSEPIKRDQFASVIDRTIAYVAREVDEVAALPAGSTRFPDVGVESPHHHAISRLADAGVIQGRADGTYQPRWDVNRGQSATFLARVLGSLVHVGVVDRPADAPAGTLAGHVTDAEDARPDEPGQDMDGVTVEIRGDAARDLVTDDEGRFDVELPPGNYDVLVAPDGYVPFLQQVEVNEGQSLTVDFRMYRSAQLPEPGEVDESDTTAAHVEPRDNFWVIPLVIDGDEVDVRDATRIVLARPDGVVLRLHHAGTSASWWSHDGDGTSNRTGSQQGDHTLYYELADGWYSLTATFGSQGQLTHVNGHAVGG